MPDCPSTENLRRLLDEEQQAGCADLDDHVEGCDDCLAKLEALADPGLQSLAGRVKPPPAWPASRGLEMASRVEEVKRLLDRCVALEGLTLLRPLDPDRAGAVWKAWQEPPGRNVVVKFIGGGTTEHRRDRTIREARALVKVDHQNILKVYSVHDRHDPPYLVLEYVGGESLAERLEAAGQPLDPDEAAHYFWGIARGLTAAHKADVAHRDIKPGNIVLADRYRAKLIDFGLATDLNGADNPAHGYTEGYASPEQKEHPDRADMRSDVYSFGAALYHALTGQLPPQDTENPSSTVNLPKGLPKEFKDICRRCLRRLPNERCDIRKVRDELEGYYPGM